LRVGGGILALLVLVAVAVVVPPTLRTPDPPTTPGAGARPGVADGPDGLQGSERLPVIGTGPLVRVVRTTGSGDRVTLSDAFTGADAGTVTGTEAARTVGRPYALQRYGYAPGLSRTISLTFDDGPDPYFTPRLLDLLSREHVPATFFVVGSAVVRHPEFVQRARREGHLVAGHSLTHADLSTATPWRARLELVWSQRILRAAAGADPSLVRLPYEGDDEESTRQVLSGVLRAERLGLVVASHDYDTDDWESPRVHDPGRLQIPPLDGSNLTVLLHDGGGDRSQTLGYVAELIRQARARGYTFTTMATAQAGLLPARPTSVRASTWDQVTVYLVSGLFDWPAHVLLLLLLLAGVSVAAGLVNCAIAAFRSVGRGDVGQVDGAAPVPTSVVIAAYNEERVIARTVRSVLASDAPLLEVLVVDDGSTDGTRAVLAELQRTDPRLRVITQENQGKATALNGALTTVRGTVAVTMDADTLITPTTVGHLVRHFAADPDGRLAAVAGVIRVGNRTRNLLTRWQALEYVTQIGVDRASQDALGAIAVVPGACAAWRVDAVRSVGGYSEATLAEDCDLTLALHAARWRIVQDDEAVAFTEAPEDVDSLLAQRTRWMYGTCQSIYKHRGLLFGRNGWLGWLVLPMYVSSIVLPLLFLPLTLLTTVLLVQQENWALLAWCLLLFLGSQLVSSAVAVLVLRERRSLLLMVPVYRLVFEPLRAYLLYTSVFMALRGARARWNKFARTGTVELPLATPLPAMSGGAS
jgi:cellulose synthase/poly-beta-1,6-N-acetylglucosamine synthase-like glycosyltransferase/peptidoglycan/xylan/chitin deacetylase (PgdA/CDA1 family)